MKILVLRFSSIGDIVLTTPVVRVLKQQLPNAEVHYATKPPFRGILENNPYIDKVHTLDGGLSALVKQLKAERYDCIIDLHNNLRTSIIKLRLGVKAYSFDKLNWEKWLYVKFKINRLPKVHIVDRYLAALQPLGLVPDNEGLDYFIPAKDEVAINSLPETHRKGYAAMAIGAQHATKRLPLHRLVELCKLIQQPIILLGGKEDADTANVIIAALDVDKQAYVYNACGKYNLNQSASLVRGAEVVYSHDTGLMHIAAAFGKRIYSIWGNTTPVLGMYPYRSPHVVWENDKLSCRPCSKIGHTQCPQGHFKCMNELVFDFEKPFVR